MQYRVVLGLDQRSSQTLLLDCCAVLWDSEYLLLRSCLCIDLIITIIHAARVLAERHSERRAVRLRSQHER
jgi:hypothetical protein